MQTTKTQILALLKRTGGSNVDEIASVLGLARMTVRQHLAMLERDDLVRAQEVRRPTGRPHFRYTLTDNGEETFPKHYDQLASMLIQEIASLDASEIKGLTPLEKQKLLLRRLADKMASQHITKVEGKPLPERVATVATILEQEGGFAEWRKRESGYEIADYNCVYRRVAETEDQICYWHLQFLGRLLGHDVKSEGLISHGANCCRFVVQEEAQKS
jgi:predicted ArsR family transcriptional regulator